MKLETLKSEITEELLNMGAALVSFNQSSDCVNLVCEIIKTDKSGINVIGHIYKSFDEDFNLTFIARYYQD